MSNDLFRRIGVNLPRILDQEFSKVGVLQGTLTRRENSRRDPNNPTKMVEIEPFTATFRGFTEEFSEVRRAGTLVRRGGTRVLAFGDSFVPAGTVPRAGDQLAIDGQTYEVIGIPNRDPARATFICQVEN